MTRAHNKYFKKLSFGKQNCASSGNHILKWCILKYTVY